MISEPSLATCRVVDFYAALVDTFASSITARVTAGDEQRLAAGDDADGGRDLLRWRVFEPQAACNSCGEGS
jgi:hypothetical protein